MKTTKTIFKPFLAISTLLFALLFMASFPVFSQGGAAINTTGAAADPSALLDLSSTNKGILITRLSTSERNAIPSPAQGLMIINTTTNCIEVFFSPMWQSVFCGCNPPTSPIAGTHTPASSEIIWNWISVNGATGYKYNTVNDYQSAIDNGNTLSYTQSGLTCNTPYTLYVWAYSACGNSTVATLTQNTTACFFCGVTNVTFTYNGSSVNYGTVTGQNATCWLDRNLGATTVATAYNHIDSYGDLFQWGRLDDGHQIRTPLSGSTTTLCSTDVPGHANFIISASGNLDWRSPQNNNLWQGVSGINNPCPNGWRLPTGVELENEQLSWSSNDYNGAFANPLHLPSAGYRNNSDAVLTGAGSQGRYWSSTVDTPNARQLLFYSTSASVYGSDRSSGRSVRCIKDY